MVGGQPQEVMFKLRPERRKGAREAFGESVFPAEKTAWTGALRWKELDSWQVEGAAAGKM